MRIIASTVSVFIVFLLSVQYSSAAVTITDTVRILAIRVEFQEDNSPTTTGNGKFDLGQPSGPHQIDPPPHNRSYFQDHLQFLHNYFSRISRHRLFLEGEVYPLAEEDAYQLDEPMTRYNPNRTPDENNAGLARLFRDAILKADDDAAIDFSQFDCVIIFHAGVGKDVNLGYDETPQDIPSLYITPQFLQSYLGIDGVPVDGGTRLVSGGIIAPETESQAGIELGLNGILASNFGTHLGWLDLFSPVTRRSGIGRFGLMDAGLFNGDGLLPALPCAWTRINAGWEQAIDVYYASGDEVTIHATLSSAAERIYRVPINEQEYFLVENRYSGNLSFDSLRAVMAQSRGEYPTAREVLQTYFADQTEFSPRGVLIDVKNPDIGLSGTGCLIWHIDERVIAQNRDANQINADPEHRGVDLEEADGSQDIGQNYDFLSPGFGSEIGWVLDMWYHGNTSPVFKNQFSPSSNPNSRSYDNRANSHITLYDFSAPDSVMTFRINLNIFQQNFPITLRPDTYGRIKSLKTADVDGDGKGDIIASTDQGKVLVIPAAGYSSWSSDSFMVADLDADLIHPPLVFTGSPAGSNRTAGMLAVSGQGIIYGFGFHNNHSLDTLFQPIRLSTSIQTHPVGFYEPDSSFSMVWGCENGKIYRLYTSGNEFILDSLAVSAEPIIYLHVDENRRKISLTSSGKVYQDATLLMVAPPTYFPPVGDRPVGVTHDGRFLLYDGTESTFAEQGLFRFDSPLIVNPFSADVRERPQYVVTGNNRMHSFNYNFTLTDNFPARLFDPDREVLLPLSPLLNRFQNAGLEETPGIVAADPAGIIDGFDLSGFRLADFPLAAGDSLATAPVILDIDGDGDAEIAAVTRKGMLYVWDLPSLYETGGWNQLYYDAMNSNRVISIPATAGGGPAVPSAQLLPEKLVYNWPNPNIENFTFIRYYLSEPAEVIIKIYDLAGDLVAEMAGSANAGTANEVRWDLQGIQSGVYIARVEARNSRVSEGRFIKIAVIK